MKNIKKGVNIDIYISKAGDQVIKYYGIFSELENNFEIFGLKLMLMHHF